MYKIIENVSISKNVFKITIENENIATHFIPGEFVVVMPDETS